MVAAPQTSETIAVRNPVSGAIIGNVPLTDSAGVQAAVARARAAQPGWAALSVKQRCELLEAWADRIWSDQEKLVQIIRDESGKNQAGAWVELAVLDSVVAYYRRIAPGTLRPNSRRPLFPVLQKARVYYEPHGVVGSITPWNYPYYNTLVDTIPALVAGNAVVLKPSELTPFTALYAAEQMLAVGIPKDVLQIVTGDGQTGAALIDAVDYVAFTGSTATGRKIAMRCAERLIPCSLELGGKDPLIVLRDADLDLAAVSTVRGALENAGQMCISIERVYVEESVYEPFIDRVTQHLQGFKTGAEAGWDVHMGSMTNERELHRVEQHVTDALAKGAKLLFGGKRRPDLGPLFYEPTLLVDVDHTMAVMQEETFGPIIPIMRARDAEHAIDLANDSEYGLGAAVFTRNLRRGASLARKIIAGDVTVNRTHMGLGTPSLPMGGRKASGLGRRGGPEGLLRYVVTQAIVVDNGRVKSGWLTLLEPWIYQGVRFRRRVRRVLPFLNP